MPPRLQGLLWNYETSPAFSCLGRMRLHLARVAAECTGQRLHQLDDLLRWELDLYLLAANCTAPFRVAIPSGVSP